MKTKLSPKTIEVLRNLASINPNLLVKPGNVLSSISVAKDIFATVKIGETFDTKFGIYDLNEFISIYGLVGDPELDIQTDRVILRDDRAQASFRFADESILVAPTKDIKMPEAEVNVSICADTIAQIRKGSGALGHKVVTLEGDNGVVKLSVVDPKNSSANTFSITLDEDNACKETFDLQFLINNIKVLQGDYDVAISSKLISCWNNTSDDAVYHIALERSSTFN